MFWKIPSFFAFGAALLLTVSAQANIVISNPVGQWHSPVSPNENPNDAFWDQRSDDGSQCNIGYWLNESNWSAPGGVGSRCGNDSFVPGTGGPGNNLAFFGAQGNAAQNVGWHFDAAGPNVITLKLEVAGNRGINEFGWYDASAASFSTAAKTLLFTGAADPQPVNPVQTVNIAAGTAIGFYLCSGACDATYSNAFYSGDGATGKFALFSEIPADPTTGPLSAYWVGIEDQPTGGLEGVGDFNDFVIRATVVPEPGFYGALAVGLGGLYMMVRRRRQS